MLNFSAFKPKVISEFNSKYSGQILVKQDWTHKYVTTGNLTQSGGLVRDVWQPVIKKFARKNKSWLILGLATGTVARLIPQPAQMLGIEIDPVMIEIGKKYFDLDNIPNLKILKLDAKDYLLKTKDKFDFILVDLYLGDQLSSFLYSPKYLKKLRKAGKTVIINHLFYDDDKRKKAQELINKLKVIFQDIRLHRILTNLMIICG